MSIDLDIFNLENYFFKIKYDLCARSTFFYKSFFDQLLSNLIFVLSIEEDIQ